MVGEMNLKRIQRNNQAVAGVIEALLMVALVSIVISLIQLHYVPQVMEQREAEHMDQVSNQIATLKSVIDTQALMGSTSTDAPLSRVPMISMITLGSRELPYFITAPSYGDLYVIDEPESTIKKVDSSNLIEICPLTSIIYNADNAYFIDQTYILEGGGIIVTQPDGESVMRADPSISIKNLSGNIIELEYYLPKIIGISGKTTTSGTGKCFIRTNYSSYLPPADNYIYTGESFIIESEYSNAWNESLNRLLEEEIKTVSINITSHPTNPSKNVVQISAKNPSYIINIKLTIVNIECQIGPGWIK
ncbi:MAG: hypothetical protein JXA00_05565 [Candidatus Thermoplasmatota archaeon]|nr:hypothetical protein [Candidatus Thermoplasmatota archaeon]